ncbi:hypothetical protein [Micromonospora sp. NPDC047134]|uniref:hypothetical protein n=1 Tax=Micromonospora sp. NPDC047134 TaxID=3154340 RepID=UPI0033ED352F
MTATRVELVPLAVTLAEGEGACVAGLTDDGSWLRPEPVTAAQVTGEDPVYDFFRVVTLDLGAGTEPDARPEDRAVLADPRPGAFVPQARRAALLRRYTDATVEEAFGGERSAGLVEVRPLRLHHRRATGGRTFLRLTFVDACDTEYDWIVRDVRMLRDFATAADPDDVAPALAGPDAPALFLAVGLTKPNGRFPGRFRGCHPLVVGVHPADGSAPTRQPAGPSGTEARSEGAPVA